MVIKKHKPSLEGVLRRRRTSVGEYFASLGVRTHEQLVTVLESLLGSYRVSEEIQEQAFAWVVTLNPKTSTKKAKPAPEKPEAIPQKEEEKASTEESEPKEEKPKKTQKRSTKRSTTRKKKRTTKSRSSSKSSEGTDEEE